MQNGADNSNTYHDHFLPCDSLLISYIKSNIKIFYVLSKTSKKHLKVVI